MADRKKDFLWIALVSALILLLSSLPRWAGYRAQTDELRFRGAFYDSQDYAVHLAMMESGRQGAWAYQFRFTTEPHNPAYIRLFYVILGHFAGWLALGSELTFQLTRWTMGFVALYALYRLMQRAFPDLFWARIAFLLAALGSGAGWLQLILNLSSGRITPIDFWLADAYVFFSIAVFPHFAFVTAATCVTLTLWLDYLRKPHWTQIASIAAIAILVQFVNPIAFATVNMGLVGATLFSWWNAREVRRADLGALLAIAFAQIPLLSYNFIVLNNDPLWAQFTQQNQTLSPPPVYYLWGFALLWSPVIAGVILALRTRSAALGAAIFWMVASFVLAYAPLFIQRRFLQNITIPLGILATAGLMKFMERVIARRPGLLRWRSSLILLFVFVASMSSILLGAGQTGYLRTYPEDLYYPASLDRATTWLREHAAYNDFVLAAEQTSQLIAQKAGLRAYLGHEMETLGYKTKQAEVQSFFEGSLPELASKPIRWIIYGPFERKLSPIFQPASHLELVYNMEGLQIYRVK